MNKAGSQKFSSGQTYEITEEMKEENTINQSQEKIKISITVLET